METLNARGGFHQLPRRGAIRARAPSSVINVICLPVVEILFDISERTSASPSQMPSQMSSQSSSNRLARYLVFLIHELREAL